MVLNEYAEAVDSVACLNPQFERTIFTAAAVADFFDGFTEDAT
jgi:hypothetical protein